MYPKIHFAVLLLRRLENLMRSGPRVTIKRRFMSQLSFAMDSLMKKHLFALGTFLTTLATFGCSGTPENAAAPIAGGQQNSLHAGSTNDSADQLASSDAALAEAQTVRIGAIDWYVNYDQAMAAARQTCRPVWLHFGENPG